MRRAPDSRAVLLLLALAVAVGLSACGSSTNKATAPAAGLSIKNLAFSPATFTAKVGDTITIMNNDTTDHTVTDSGGAFDTGHIAPGTTKTISVTKAGTYSYHCDIHSFMKGTIQVS